MQDTVSARDLRNHTGELLRRAQSGETLRITVNRLPVAELRPLAPRPPWVSGAVIEEVVRDAPADAGLTGDLAPLRSQPVDPR